MEADVVLEGGGVKVIGLLGAIAVAQRRGFHFRRLAGTSAGALLAALLAAGYRAEELWTLMMAKNFSNFLVSAWYDYLPRPLARAGRFLRLCYRNGLYAGDSLEAWISKLLQAKGVQTFADLPSLSIIASDVTLGQMVVLPQDLAAYGASPTDVTVARAVRMSCSIPFLFDPAPLLHREKQMICKMVDGGILSNFPLWLFHHDPPRRPTLGFCFISPRSKVVRAEQSGLLVFLRSVIFTMLNTQDDRCFPGQKNRFRTIQVPSLGVQATNFSLSSARKELLYQAGEQAAEAFFANWSFSTYLADRQESLWQEDDF